MQHPKYAGFWIRAAANLIDSLWMTLLMLVPVIIVAYFDVLSPDTTAYVWFYVFTQFILPGIIVVGLWSYFETTPGKLACGIKVVDNKTFEAAGVLKYSLRYLAYFISLIVFFVGYLWIAFDKKKRGWHDHLSSTVVIYR